MFELGSITKAVTGLLLADAVVRGEVALDTSLADCLPGARPRAAITLGRARDATRPGCRACRSRSCAARGFTNLTDPYAGSTVEELLADLARVRPRRRPHALLELRRRAARPGARRARRHAVRARSSTSACSARSASREVWAHGAPGGRAAARPPRPPGPAVDDWAPTRPAGCLRGTVARRARARRRVPAPPPALAEAVALALTPRAQRGPMRVGPGLDALARRPAASRCGGTTAARTAAARSPASCRRRGRAVAAVANAPKSPDRARRRWLSSARSRARSGRGRAARRRAGRPARRCPSPGTTKPHWPPSQAPCWSTNVPGAAVERAASRARSRGRRARRTSAARRRSRPRARRAYALRTVARVERRPVGRLVVGRLRPSR